MVYDGRGTGILDTVEINGLFVDYKSTYSQGFVISQAKTVIMKDIIIESNSLTDDFCIMKVQNAHIKNATLKYLYSYSTLFIITFPSSVENGHVFFEDIRLFEIDGGSFSITSDKSLNVTMKDVYLNVKKIIILISRIVNL